MTFEQKPNQFNKENFKSEFEIALQKYVHSEDSLAYNNYISEHEDAIEAERKSLQLDSERAMEQMIKLSAHAIKIAPNKDETFDLITKSFRDLNISLSQPHESHELTDSYAQVDFFKKVIIELLKGN